MFRSKTTRKTAFLARTAAALTLGGVVIGAQAQPGALSLEELDRLTAGSAASLTASGGAIVGNDSSANITSSGSVSLEDEVQSGARGLNLVNSAESTVANGVNVFDGRADGAVDFNQGTTFNVDQHNEIIQEQRRVASVPYYRRSEANVDLESADIGSSYSQSSVTDTNLVTDIESSSSALSNESSGSVDALSTILGQQIQAGRGISGAGDLDVDFVAGHLDIQAGGGVTFGDVEFSGDVSVFLELPQLKVQFQGAGCAVQNGSCEATGSFSDISEELVDKSTAVSHSSSQTSEETWDSYVNEQVRAPFTLLNAQAEYIVVDSSELNVDSTYVVALSGSAQSDLRGMNAVNAAGSAVANGVNVSTQRSASLNAAGGPVLNLTQSNVINHSR